MKIASGRIARASGFAVTSAIVVIGVSLLIAGTPGSPGDTTADKVLGQDDFAHNIPTWSIGKAST